MFCSKCGNKLNDTDKFCAKCGTKVEEISSKKVDLTKSEVEDDKSTLEVENSPKEIISKEQYQKILNYDETNYTTPDYKYKYDYINIDFLKNAQPLPKDTPLIQYLEYVKSLAEPIYQLQEEIENVNNRIRTAENSEINFKSRTSEVIRNAIIVAVVALLFKSVLKMGVFIVWCIDAIIAFVMYLKVADLDNKDIIDLKEHRYQTVVKPIIDEKEYLERLYNECLASAGGKILLDMLPEKYLNLSTIEILLGYAINRRADTLKEALNLYENELQNARNMQMQQDMLSKQQELISKINEGNSKLDESNYIAKLNALINLDTNQTIKNGRK